MARRLPFVFAPALLAVYMPMCGTPQVRPVNPSPQTPLTELWERPDDLARRDLYFGPWGKDYAPDPRAVYTFVKPKRSGKNPGMTVVDPAGRRWQVKQAPHDDKVPEGPIEVTVSRILSAVGYHQPPVYLLPAFTLADPFGSRREPGGRFRLDGEGLKERGTWSWQENPFVGTRPYQGLLVILLMLNSSDLKNENNSLYERSTAHGTERWFVVRDLGISLGSTGRIWPPRGDPDRFDEHGFITGIEDGFVTFEYHGFHEELVRSRITPAEVRWASALLAGLSDAQWHDAFRAGGYELPLRERFIRRLREKIRQGLAIG
jgi:hypothetical protein